MIDTVPVAYQREYNAVRIIVFAALLFANLGGAYASPAPSEPGVTTTTIKLGGVITQTGSPTVISLPVLGGYQLAIKQINAQGGIDGRKIEYSALSDNYDASQTLPQVKQLVEADGVFAVLGIFGSDDANAAIPYLEHRQVPLFDPIGGGANVVGKHWVWQTEPDYGREGKVMASFVTKQLGARRIGILYQVGVGEPQVKAIQQVAPADQATVVGVASYESTSSNLSGQVIRLRGANPDVVVLNGNPTQTAAFLQYARALNFRPRYGYIANYPMGDPLWLHLIGSNAEGNYVSSYADLTGRNPVARAYRQAIARYGGGPYSNYGLYGYFNAMLFFKALKLAGRQLTRARVQYVLDHDFRRYQTGLTGRLDWSLAQRYGARQFKMYRIHHLAFVPVTGWLNP